MAAVGSRRWSREYSLCYFRETKRCIEASKPRSNCTNPPSITLKKNVTVYGILDISVYFVAHVAVNSIRCLDSSVYFVCTFLLLTPMSHLVSQASRCFRRGHWPACYAYTPLSLNHVKSKKQETNIKKYCAFPVCRAGRPRCDPIDVLMY